MALGAKALSSVGDKIEEVADKAGMGDTLDKAKDKLSEMKENVSEGVDSVAERVRGEAPVDESKLEKISASGEEE